MPPLTYSARTILSTVEPDPTRRALRLLQVHDELTPGDEHRALRMLALDALGEALGLKCTGTDDGGGFYDHSSGTCPIHEWLDPSDCPK